MSNNISGVYLPLALSITMWVGMCFIPICSNCQYGNCCSHKNPINCCKVGWERPCESPHLQSLLKCNRIFKVEASFHCQTTNQKLFGSLSVLSWNLLILWWKSPGSFRLLKELEPANLLWFWKFFKELEVGALWKIQRTTKQRLVTKPKNHRYPTKAVKYPLSPVYISSSTSLGPQLDKRLVGTEVVTQHLKVSKMKDKWLTGSARLKL